MGLPNINDYNGMFLLKEDFINFDNPTLIRPNNFDKM
jgi:hypothetical protein